MNDIFKQFAEIRQQIKDLEAKKDELELEVLEELDSHGGKLPTQWGTFLSSGRNVWDYSDSVKSLSQQLSQVKKLEEGNGTATLRKVTSFVRLEKPTE